MSARVVLSREEYEELHRDAERWRTLLEWHQRAQAAADSKAIAAAEHWIQVANSPTYEELRRRRAVLGPNARPFDAEAAARWVQYGTSNPQGVSAA